jgi:prolyl-tRNA synthetase
MANDIYLGMLEANIDVLYDNRYVRPGVKFVDADLIGIPYQVIVSAKSIEDGMVDLKERATGKMERMDVQDAINKIAEAIKCLQEQF